MTAILLLAVAAVTMTMTACAPVTPAPTTPGGGAGGAEPPGVPAPDPPPPLTETEKSWALDAAAFGDDGGSIWAETSNRSVPFAWDAITAGNVDGVRVSIGGKRLPLANSAYEPAFASDFSGAEWKIEADVSPGAVVLEISAENQRVDRGEVDFVTITNPGSGYTSAPNVIFGPAPAGGETATATAAVTGLVTAVTVTSGGSGYSFTSPSAVTLQGGGGSDAAATMGTISYAVASVTVTNSGSGYTAAPVVTFSPCNLAPCVSATGTAVLAAGSVASVTLTTGGSGYLSTPWVVFVGGSGSGAAGTATLAPGGQLRGVVVTNRGSGYTSAPSVVISGGSGSGAAATATAVTGVYQVTVTDRGRGYTTAPSVTISDGGGSGATAAATLRRPRGNSQAENLWWARQAVYGKELLVEIGDE